MVERFEQHDVEEEQDIGNAQMGPMIQVVLDADREPIIFPFSELGVEAGDPGMVSDDRLLQLAEEWLRLERGENIAQGQLAGWKVSRPQTGNVMISRPAVFGDERRHCPKCKKGTLQRKVQGGWICTVCQSFIPG